MRKGKEMVRHARGAALFLLACFASAARAATAIPDGESEPAHYAVLFLKLFFFGCPAVLLEILSAWSN